ncbi:MAG: zinc-dependent alcohol dehydrogenase family protein [Treponema sp.]|jgi:2-desacetyl-2-hydroxyethyl bacteriochlorophyllide A dehydrogenase|nr:zinc-dependent alcohol dehydrogenase family protein [Treponema sp.]
MKALVIEKPGKAQVCTVDIPSIKDNEVLIKIKVCGICGTDVHIYRGEYLGSYPVIPGHEFSGIIEQVGKDVTRFQVGDHVAVEPNIACNNCDHCFNNRQNFCDHWSALGVTVPGGFAEYTAAPEQAVFNIGTLPFSEGAFVEPLSCVLHGVQRAQITVGDKVLIIGAGPIGILLSQAVQIHGASEVTQIDKNEARLEKARQNGAAVTATTVEQLVHNAYDVVIDATGVPFLMEKTLDYVRFGGTILWFGVPHREAQVSLPAFTIFEKGLRLLSSYTSVRNSLQAIRLLQSKKINVSTLISHQLPLEDFVKGVEIIEQGTENVVKVVLTTE